MTKTINKKVLLIEDDLAIIDIYQIMMKKEHLDVEVISLGLEAIERIKGITKSKQPKPDIILLDLTLPDINGMEVFKAIKENTLTKNICVFILTNQQDIQLEWPNNVGPDKFLIKANTGPAELLEIIKQELNK